MGRADTLTEALKSIITANLPGHWRMYHGTLIWLYADTSPESVGWFWLIDSSLQAWVNGESPVVRGWEYHKLDLANPANTEEAIYRFIKDTIKLMRDGEMRKNGQR